LPVWNDFLFPLPVLHLGVFRRPAIGDPVRLSVLGSPARTAGKADDDLHFEHFGQEDGFAEGIDVFLGMLGVGMNGVAMTTESGDAYSPVFKLFQPSSGLTAIADELVQGAMGIVRIASRADLHGLQTQWADLVQHGVEGEMFIDGIEHADGDLTQVTRRFGCGKAWSLGICRVGDHFSPWNCGHQQAARGSQKLPPADGGVLGLFLHACPWQTRQLELAPVSRRYYTTMYGHGKRANRFSIEIGPEPGK